jgi:uncharacterized protein YutE (UPF0331/DUF86 family)
LTKDFFFGSLLAIFNKRIKEKAMNFKEFFEKAEKQVKKSDNIIFEFFLERIIREIDDVEGNPTNWQETEFDLKYANNFYHYSVHTLWDMAVAFAHDSDDEVYEQATEIVSILRGLLSQEFGMKFEPAIIMSPTKQMAEEGLLEVEEVDGEKFVRLSSKGKQVAQEVEESIEKTKQRDNN